MSCMKSYDFIVISCCTDYDFWEPVLKSHMISYDCKSNRTWFSSCLPNVIIVFIWFHHKIIRFGGSASKSLAIWFNITWYHIWHWGGASIKSYMISWCIIVISYMISGSGVRQSYMISCSIIVTSYMIIWNSVRTSYIMSYDLDLNHVWHLGRAAKNHIWFHTI